ncbi:MAG: DUF6152 family protein [Pseudomonadota bacterium]
MKLIAALLVLMSGDALAHHSYADYDRAERYELRGVLTDIHWANPHILFTVSDGERSIRIEWITVTGAEVTSVSKEQFAIGDAVLFIGSRNRNPDVQTMTVIKEVQLPGKDWRWVSPSEKR